MVSWHEDWNQTDILNIRIKSLGISSEVPGAWSFRSVVKGHSVLFVGDQDSCFPAGTEWTFFQIRLALINGIYHVATLPGTGFVELQNDPCYGTYVELCCGLGGLAVGSGQMGISPCVALDISPLSVEVYGNNHPTPVMLGNVQDPADLYKLLSSIQGLRCGLAAGFPCPPFSSRGDQLGFGDARALVFVDCLNAAFLFHSCFVVLECTPATGKWAEVEELLTSFAVAMGFCRSQGILHLHRTWPFYRTRWWTILVPEQCAHCLHPLRDLPELPHLRCIQDAFPCWPLWPQHHERHLEWTEDELHEYQKYVDVDTTLLSMTGVSPTLLHSCGHHFHPCPCGCRLQGLAPRRLSRDGVSVVAVRSTSDPSKVRHLHPAEAGYLCTLPPSFSYPMKNLRAGLPLVGQIAAPAQAHWVFLQLHLTLGQAGLVAAISSQTIDEQHYIFISSLLHQRTLAWKTLGELGDFEVCIRQHDITLKVRAMPGTTVGQLLDAHCRLSDWGTRAILSHDGVELPRDYPLRALIYDLHEYKPKQLRAQPVDPIEIDLKGEYYHVKCCYPPGIWVANVMCDHDIQYQAGSVFEENCLLWGDRLWTSQTCTTRGAGPPGLSGNLGLLDFQVADEALLLLSQAPPAFILLSIAEVNLALAKPAVIANFLLKRLIQRTLESYGCPEKIGVIFCTDNHWAFFHFDTLLQQSRYFDGIPNRVSKAAHTLAIAFGQFFECAQCHLPCESLLLQGDDDLCGTIALVNLGWMLNLWEDFQYADIERWQAAIRNNSFQCGLGGSDYAAVHAWLVNFLPSRGVPEAKVAERSALAIKKLGLQAVGKAINSGQPWQQLKSLGSSASKPFLWLTHEELQDHIAARSQQKQGDSAGGRKVRKVRDPKPKEPFQISPEQITLVPKSFVDSDGKALPQVHLQDLKPDSRGVAIVTVDQAQRFLLDSKSISHDHLGLVTTLELPSQVPGTLTTQKLTWPALFQDEPLLIKGSLIQIGDLPVALKLHPASKAAIVDTALLRLQLYRDEWPHDWTQVTRGPLKQLINHFPPLQLCRASGCGTTCPKFHPAIDETCDLVILDCFAWRWLNEHGAGVAAPKASSFSVMIRTPETAVDGILRASGQEGFYTEVREDASQTPSKYVVVWTRLNFEDISHSLRTIPQALHIARLQNKYGLRCLRKHEGELREVLYPGQPFISVDVKVIYQVGPWPHGVTKQVAQETITALPWEARVMKPAKGTTTGRFWIVGAGDAPPFPLFQFGSDQITITKVKEQAATPSVTSNIVATMQTMQKLQEKSIAPQKPDPWLQQDPWSSYKGTSSTGYNGAASSSAPNKRIDEIENKLTASVQEQIRAQIESIHSAPMQIETSLDEERIARIETNMVELQQQSQRYEQWFQESADRVNQLQHNLNEQGEAIKAVHNSVQIQQQNYNGLQSSFQALENSVRAEFKEACTAQQAAISAQTERLEALLSKRHRQE